MRDELTRSKSDEKGASFSFNCTGTRVAFKSWVGPNYGYGLVILLDKNRKVVLSTLVDFYCAYPETSLKFMSPKLKKGNYTLRVSVLGERWSWILKSGKYTRSGGNYVSLDEILFQL